ncbi:unannotated protein [freshwater metagenome]|uniref:Unannotated protein n=1 Tax=freshwater metagenome TaxID=449393 RepID=A0A6J7NA80_9ZZZZ
MRVGAQSASNEDAESRLNATGAVFTLGNGSAYSNHTNIVEHGLATVGGAAREVDLEFPW